MREALLQTHLARRDRNSLRRKKSEHFRNEFFLKNLTPRRLVLWAGPEVDGVQCHRISADWHQRNILDLK